MATPKPSAVSLSKIKSSLLRPALTSNYSCWFFVTKHVAEFLKKSGLDYDSNKQDLLSLSCAEASLPGSSLMTNEVSNDYTGVTEKFAYRRDYGGSSSFTFYVDHNGGSGYNVIWFFEAWMSCIAKEEINPLNPPKNYHYRFEFPENYRSDIYIDKFERDFKGTSLSYQFIDAYPTSIDAMPVSYEASDLLKCTVNFTYTRYLTSRKLFGDTPSSSPAPTPSTGTAYVPVKGSSGIVYIPKGMTYAEALAAGKVVSNASAAYVTK